MDIRSNLVFSGGAKISGLPAATATGEPVTFEQLNSLAEGISWKDSVRVSSTANINLSAPGATIDGITMVANDRFLAKDQSTASQNGIYIWNGAASVATRALDASTFAELEAAVVTVEEGTNAGTTYRQTAVNGTIDSSSVTWTTFGTSAPAASDTVAGLVELATTAETTTGTDNTRAVTPSGLANSVWARKAFSATFGDGSATQYDITHNFGTNDVQIGVYIVADGVEVWCDRKRQTTNSVRLNFAAAPASNSLRCVVQA